MEAISLLFLPHPAGGKAASRVGPKIVLDHVRVYICDLSRENVAYAIFLEMHFIMHSCKAIFALFIATYHVKIGQSVAKLLPI